MHLIPQFTGDRVVYASTAGAGLWETLRQLAAHGPGWEMLPPLILALAGLVGAVRAWRTDVENWRDRDQERRHKEDLHRAEMERLRGTLSIEQLPSKN